MPERTNKPNTLPSEGSNTRGTDNRLIGIVRHWLMADSFDEPLNSTGNHWRAPWPTDAHIFTSIN
jgi:hypothetical protein